MVSKTFRINLVVRLLLLFLLGNSAVYILWQTPYWLVSIWIILFLVLAIIELVRYIEKNYRNLSDFLMGVKQNDFSYIGSIQQREDTVLGKAFSHVAELIQNLRLQAESNYQYLQTVVNHIDVGILCYDETGRMNLVNQAACKFFQLTSIRNTETLKRVDKGFYDLIKNLQPGKKELYHPNWEGHIYQLAVYATCFRMENKNFKLVSFQNIKGELEQKEMESWHRLTRVLTHEIMNSAIPISNLSGMVYDTIYDEGIGLKDLTQVDEESREELLGSLKTIQSRSRGLANFVSSTRKITRLPAPELQKTDLFELLRGVFSLFSQKLKAKNIDYKLEGGKDTVQSMVEVDPEQMEQVFINLLQNSVEAVENSYDPYIRIIIKRGEHGNVLISFADNGKGMTAEERENLFVPFYTTKKQGTGIGLTLSRHIIHNHQGTMDVKSEEGKGTEFIIKLTGEQESLIAEHT